MVFTAKSPKINIDEVRSLSKLEGQVLANKLQRDQELEAIIRGEDPVSYTHLTLPTILLV